jgi:hypothetical protein
MFDGEGNRLGVVGSTEFPCTTAMENLCSCDEIRGFRVRPRWKTFVVATKFGVSVYDRDGKPL